jgi:hypothetical protein
MKTKWKIEIATVEPYSWLENGTACDYYANEYVNTLHALFDTENDALMALYQYYSDNEINVTDVSGTYWHCIENGGEIILELSDGEYSNELRSVRLFQVLISFDEDNDVD